MAGFRTVAIGAALIAATAGAVSAQTTQGTARPDSAKIGDWRRAQPGQRRGEMGPRARRGMESRMRRHGGQRGHGMRGMDFMRGLSLTETQRTQVRAIHEKYRPQMKATHERARTEFEATREARQRGDTAAVKATLQRSRQNIASQSATLHEQMFREVRGILTAEQRTKIDAGIVARIKRLDDDKARLERLRR